MKHIYLIPGLMLMATLAHAEYSASPERLHEVAERGVHVMPFDLEKTLHVFKKAPDGGVQQVVAKDAADAEQITLIRQHLAAICEGFKQGDFSRQRRIHGDDMPGIAELAAAYPQVSFKFRDLPNGAEIVYSADDAGLVDAIHRYFDAQLTDHGRHAIGKQAAQREHKHNPQLTHSDNASARSKE